MDNMKHLIDDEDDIASTPTSQRIVMNEARFAEASFARGESVLYCARRGAPVVRYWHHSDWMKRDE